MLLMFQSRQQHFRPGICKNNTFLSTILNLRIISIKRFVSEVHACVNGAVYVKFVSVSAPFTHA